MDGVRIELTVLESGGVTARWTTIGRLPSLFATSSSLRRTRRSPLLFAMSENDGVESGWRESNPLPQEGALVPDHWATPAKHGRKESNLQQRVLEARALADGASAVEGLRS